MRSAPRRSAARKRLAWSDWSARCRPGLRADLCLIDLADIAFTPCNSVARQLVYSETGRGVTSTVVDGRVVMRDRVLLTIDEAAFRRDLAEIMPGFPQRFRPGCPRQCGRDPLSAGSQPPGGRGVTHEVAHNGHQ